MLRYVSIPHSFVWLNNTPLCRYTTCCLSVHELMDICFFSHILLIMNNVAMNIHAQVFL